MVKRMRMHHCLISLFCVLALHCEVAIPDWTGHSSTSTYIPPTVDSTIAITLTQGVGIETGELFLSWTRIDSAVQYRLEEATNDAFAGSMVIYQGPQVSARVTSHNDWLVRHYRSRAEFHDRVSLWSNTVSIQSDHSTP